jgi:hypothetical protein
MNWLCPGKPDWDQHPERIEDAAKRKPMGIAPHGSLVHSSDVQRVESIDLRRIS